MPTSSRAVVASTTLLLMGISYSLAEDALVANAPFAVSNFVTFDPGSLHMFVRVDEEPYEEGGYDVPIRIAGARIKLDNDDILDMPSFAFPRINARDGGQDDGTTLAIYTRMTASKVLAEEEEDYTIWQGALDGDEVGFATVLRNADGSMAGSFTIGGTAYMMNTMPDNSTVIGAVLFEDLPEEVDLDEEEPSEEEEDSSLTGGAFGSPIQPLDADEEIHEGRGGPLYEEEGGPNEDEPTYRGLRGSDAEAASDPENKLDIRDATKELDHGRMLPRTKIIDLLAVVTNRAMCEEAGRSVGCAPTVGNRRPIESVLRVATAQMNSALSTIGIDAQIRLVRIHFDLTGFDGGVSETTLSRLRGSGDGVLDNVHSIRENVGADLVTLITGAAGSSRCGIAYRPGAHSVTNYQCIAGYTFIHELGHSFGCYHNAAASGTHSYANGHLDPSGVFRTVMSYDCPGGCPRIPYFSNDDYTYGGRLMGSSSRDNKRMVSERAGTVESYRPTRISSPSTYSYYFYIINPYTNKALDVAWAGCSDNQNIHLWRHNGGRAQIFRWGSNGSIMNVHCDKALTVSGGYCSTNTNIVLSRYTGSSSQSFRRDSDGTIMSNRCGKTVDIDATNGGADGANIKIYPKNGNWDQQWRIEYF